MAATVVSMVATVSMETIRDDTNMFADAASLIRAAWSINRSRMIAQMVLFVVNGFTGGIGLLLLVPIVNAVAAVDGVVKVPLVGSLGLASHPLWLLLTIFLLLVGFQAVIGLVSNVNSTRLQQEVVDHLRSNALESVLKAKWAFVLQLQRSDIMQVVTAGSSRSGMAVNQMLNTIISTVLAISTAAIAVVVSPLVASLALVGVIALAVAQGTAIRPAHRLGRMLSEKNRRAHGVVVDSLDSLRLVRAHDASQIWVDRLVDAFSGAREVMIANTIRASSVSALTSLGTALAASALVLVSTWADVEPVSIAVLLVLVSRLSRQTQSVVRNATQLANSLPAVGEVVALTRVARDAVEVASPSSERVLPSSVVDKPGGALIEFEGVTYLHAGSGRGVHDVTFVVPDGRITALVGRSGSGKSTTADLALGLLYPQSGSVVVGGVELEPELSPWWRTHVAYVPQETVLISGTLRDNLVWSVSRSVSDEECLTALHRAAATFVDNLPNGLDTILGDRGVRLSGGERQRVAIARALLRTPSLLVLDEATSSLDDETEEAVLETIEQLVPTVTVLVIAHRQSTIARAHHVVWLEEGRVV